ncbi:MDIS1-interacting receptor like kinase 2-like [Arachis stenosperma]|uniref:MDIS1-interacting receptor like kinase 2-like n=1 Tax=Arachis stenosperma TaxID=217475 RepID=UPI0025ACF5B0|nr:MDIS1-interacting receptor like kinase 2-like [Arachis stenosperma]
MAISFTCIVFILVPLVFVGSITTNAGTHKSKLSPLDQEANALLSISELWGIQYINVSNRCHWPGIKCNKAGSITTLSPPTPRNYSSDFFPQLCNMQLKFLVFPNLVRLDFSEMGLCEFPKLRGLKKLQHLNLSYNRFSGEAPLTLLTNLTQLVVLDISNNQYISGPIPQELSKLERLVTLDLSANALSEGIPLILGQMSSLTHMKLSNNLLYGDLPFTLANLTQLLVLDLSQNKLSGFIPHEIGKLTNLLTLDLSSNSLSGPIPEQIGYLNRLTSLHLHSNWLSGYIPSNIGLLTRLEVLTIGSNMIDGCIPKEIEHFYNNLSGSIPSQIGNLSYLDLRYNNLSIKNTKGFESITVCYLHCNPFLPDENYDCDDPQDQLEDHHNKHSGRSLVLVIIVVCITISLGSVGIGICIFHARHHGKLENKATKNGDLFSIWNYDGKIAFEDIIQATQDFDIGYCIGTGAYGSVYEARLPSGKTVALKKLHKTESENPSFYKSFCNEVEVLTEIRHRNIIRLYGYCLHNRCMFLVYEYLERGSLYCNLVDEMDAQELKWSKRVSLMLLLLLTCIIIYATIIGERCVGSADSTSEISERYARCCACCKASISMPLL